MYKLTIFYQSFIKISVAKILSDFLSRKFEVMCTLLLPKHPQKLQKKLVCVKLKTQQTIFFVF